MGLWILKQKGVFHEHRNEQLRELQKIVYSILSSISCLGLFLIIDMHWLSVMLVILSLIVKIFDWLEIDL